MKGIFFLKDYSVGTPVESFSAGETVQGRGEASEAHFVRRGVAAYIGDDGVLTDFDGNVVETPEGLKAKAPKVEKTERARAPRTPAKPKAASTPRAAAAASAAPPSGSVLGRADLKPAAATVTPKPKAERKKAPAKKAPAKAKAKTEGQSGS